MCKATIAKSACKLQSLATLYPYLLIFARGCEGQKGCTDVSTRLNLSSYSVNARHVDSGEQVTDAKCARFPLRL